MTARFGQTGMRKAIAAFTLVEVMISIAILALAMAGMITCYIQTNRQAEWSSISLAAQSSASAAVEQALAAKWYVHGTILDEFQVQTGTNYIRTNTMVIPGTGESVTVTNYVSITNVFVGSTSIKLRQIRADCSWRFPYTSAWFSNTVIIYRAPNQ